MYTPKAFEQNDEIQIEKLIENYPFATLVCSSAEGMEANHVPMVLAESDKGERVLKGHIAKANSLWKIVEHHSSALAIFHGPHTYISPSVYPTKKEHGKAVPTWNYATVHVKGKISFIHDAEWKLDMLNRLTDTLEIDREFPWKVSDAPTDYIERQLKGIVGIEFIPSSFKGQWKLSQNQPAQNQIGVRESLSSSGNTHDQDMLDMMKNLG